MRLGGNLRRTGGIGILVVVLVLGYGLYTGAIGPELLLGTDAGSGGSGEAGSGPSRAPGAPAPPSAAEARGMLGDLEVATAGSMAGYSREEFPHWAADGRRFGWDEPDWSETRREDYANDPGVLLSVDDAANQTKGDKGPEAWRPPNADYSCEYARRWISIKHQWDLTVNTQEKAALQGCPP